MEYREATLGTWIEQAIQIAHRRPSAAKHRAIDQHIEAFPADLVQLELDVSTLDLLEEIIVHGVRNAFGRPHRGHRENHWTTQALVDARNQKTASKPSAAPIATKKRDTDVHYPRRR